MQFSDLCMTVIILRISSLYSLIFHPLLVTNANSHETIKQKKELYRTIKVGLCNAWYSISFTTDSPAMRIMDKRGGKFFN